MVKKILIYGSCVSRDPFTESIKEFEIVDYFARSSFASLSGSTFTQSLNLDLIQSKFQRRQVQRDIEKIFLKRIELDDFDILIVDFTDDRFNLLHFPDGSLLTLSAELRKVIKKAHHFKEAKLVDAFSDLYFEFWCNGYEKIINTLKKNDSLNKLVVNFPFWGLKDELGNAFDHEVMHEIEKANFWFDRIYKKINEDVPISQFCRYPKDLCIASSQHKWGRAPFHFCTEFEAYFINFLRRNYIEFNISE